MPRRAKRNRAAFLSLAILLSLVTSALVAGTLTAVAPTGASGAVPISITGSGFDAVASRNEVSFVHPGGTTITAAGESITSLDATGRRRLTLRVPSGVPVGRVNLSVRNLVNGETSAGMALEVLSLTLPDVSSAQQGASGVSVRIVGSSNTRFVQGATTVTFRSGITVTAVTVDSDTSLVATINVASSAALGASQVQVKTSTQTALLPTAFQVTAPPPPNRAPVANVGGPYAGNVGESVAFNGAASTDPDGDALSFSWDFGDGSTGSGEKPTHVYAAQGTYSVVLTVSDGRGGTNQSTTTASVVTPPPPNKVPQAAAGGPYSAVAGIELAFSGAGSSDPDGDALTYAWDFGDGGKATTVTPSHTYAASGTFTVTLTVDDGKGGTNSATTTAVISAPPPINRPPTANAGGPYKGLTGTAVTFDGRQSSDPDGDPLAYTWSFGDAATGSGAQPSHTYASAGTYSVSVTIDDGRGGTATAASSVTITAPGPANQAPVARPGGPYTEFAGSPLVFDGSQSSDADHDPLTLTWTFGDGSSAAGSSPSHTYASAGDYTVTLKVEDGRGGVNTATVIAAISTRPSNRAPLAHAGGPYQNAVDVLIAFDGSQSSDPDGNALAYAWDFGDGTSGTGKLAKHAYLKQGTFTATLTVTDTAGLSASATAAVMVDAPSDRAPPVLTLSGPREALPGSQVTIEAHATDNVKVDEVRFDVSGASPSVITTAPYRRIVDIPAVATPGDLIKVTATARDSSANSASAEAAIKVVSSADTTPPAIVLHVPAEVGRGSTLNVSAKVTDTVGVDIVAFVIDGQSIPVPAGQPPVVTFDVAADRPVGSPVHVLVRAADYAGNTSEAEATVAVIAERDVTPPLLTLSAPPETAVGTLLPMTAVASDAAGIASLEFFVLDVRVHTVTDQPYSAQYPVASSFSPGTILRLKAIARDFSGNQAEATATSVVVRAATLTKSLVTGEVYDDTSGLPLPDVSVALAGASEDGAAFQSQAISDTRGRFVLPARPGTATIAMTRDGWSRSLRQATLQNGMSLEIFDGRLTRLAPAGPPISPLLGGTIAHDGFELELAPGALTEAVDLRLTALGQQGIPALMPTGWSPASSVAVTPLNVPFVGVQTLRLPNSLNLAVGTGLAAVRFDDAARAWRTLAVGVVAGDGSLPAVQIPGGGEYAWVVADAAPSVPPSPTAGALLLGAGAAAVPDDATTVINPQPRIIFYKPGVFSDVGTRVSGQAALGSGAQVLSRISESYRFFAGTEQHPDPFTQDLVLFQRQEGGGAIEATSRVTPSLTFEALALELGVITVDVRPLVAADRVSEIVDEDGGTITSPTGEELRLPPGAGEEASGFGLQRLLATELGVALPQGLSFAGAAYVSFTGQLGRAATLSIPRPPGIVDGADVLLAQLQPIAGEDRLVLVAAARVAGDRLESDIALGGNPTAFSGIRSAGRYVFVRPSVPFGFVGGRVLGLNGALFAGALVTTPTLPLAAISGEAGYLAAGAVGTVPLTALDILRSDSGSGQGTLPAARALIAVDLPITSAPPTVVSLAPANSATNVPLGTALTARFSRPMDQGTGAGAQLTGPGNAVLPGAVVWSQNGTVLTFRPSSALEPNASYVFTLSTALRDVGGRALAAAVSSQFESLDTNPPPKPPAGSITASLPNASGVSTVRGTQGTAGRNDTVTVVNLNRKTITPVVLDPDGGFIALVDAALSDRLRLRIVDAAGNETFVDLPRFSQVNADGSVTSFVGSEGGRVEGPNGSAVDVKEGTFPEGVTMTLRYVSEAQFPIQLTDEDRELFSYSGGIDIDLGGVKPQSYLNISLPAQAGDGGEDQWIVGQIVVSEGQTLFNMVDRARVIDGRIATSSPPCPGILAQSTYAFVKSKKPVGLNYMKVAIRDKANAALLFARYASLTLAGAASARFGAGGLAGSMVGIAIIDTLAASAVVLSPNDVCLPSLTGRATITPNVVHVTVPVSELRPADRQVVVTNPTTTETRTFARSVANLIVEVRDVAPDWYEATAEPDFGYNQDLGSTGPSRFRDPAFSVSVGADGKALVSVNGDVLNLVPARIVVNQVFKRVKGEGTNLGDLGAEFVVRGDVGDTYEVYSARPCCAHISSDLVTVIAGDNPGEVKVRIAPAPLAQLDPNNDDFEIKHVTTKSVDAPGPLRFAVEGTPSDNITVELIDSGGTKRTVQPQLGASRAGTGRLVLKVLKATIDPPNQELNGMSRMAGGVTLVGPQGGSVPEEQIVSGGIAGWSFNGTLGSEYRLTIDYATSVAAPDPSRRISEPISTMTITARNHETGVVWKTIERPTPPRDEPVYLGRVSEDTDAPVLLTTDADLTLIDPSLGLTFRFSEGMDPRSLRNGIVVKDSKGRRVLGEVRVSDSNRMATFVPASGLRLGETYTIEFADTVVDASGNVLPVLQSVRRARVFAPTMLSSVKTVPGGASLQLLQDMTLVTGTVQGREESTIVGVTRGAQFVSPLEANKREATFKFVTFDVTDPAKPTPKSAVLAGKFPHGSNWRVHVVKGVDTPLYVPENPPDWYPTDPPRPPNQLKGNLAIVTRFSKEASLLQFYDITDLNAPRTLDDKILTTDPSVNVLADERRGAYATPGYVKSVTTLFTSEGFTAYAAVGEVGLMAVQSKLHLRTPPPLERTRAPSLTGNYVDVTAIGGRLYAVDVDAHTLDEVGPDLSLRGSASLGAPAHAVVAAPGYGFDYDKDGVIEPSETRDLVIAATDESLLIVDATTPGNLSVLGTIPVATKMQSPLDYNPARGWIAVSMLQPGASTGQVASAAVIEIGDPRRFGLIDADSDGLDDRVSWVDPDSVQSGNGVQVARFDPRGYLYVSRTLPYAEDFRGQLEVWDLGGHPRVRYVEALASRISATAPGDTTTESEVVVVRPGDSVRLSAHAVDTGCQSVSFRWDLDGTTASGASIVHIYNEVGERRPRVTAFCGDDHGPSDDATVIVANKVVIKEVWSDQVPGKKTNYLPDGAGQVAGGSKQPYMLMATRADGRVYLKATVYYPDDLRGRVLVGVRSPLVLLSPAVSTLEGFVASVQISNPPLTDVPLRLIAGVDLNGNGVLEPDEEPAESGPISVVTPASYVGSLDVLKAGVLLSGLDEDLSTARGFLRAFIYGEAIPFADRISQVTLSANDSRLSHVVGAPFDDSRSAVIDKFTFLANSETSKRVLASADLWETIKTTLSSSAILAELRERARRFITDGDIDPHFAYPLPGFTMSPDGLLNIYSDPRRFNLGAAFNSVSSALVVEGVVIADAFGVYVRDIRLRGSIEDLYDWDYGLGGLNADVARVQAGYGTLGNGNAGKVFITEVFIDGAPIEQREDGTTVLRELKLPGGVLRVQ